MEIHAHIPTTDEAQIRFMDRTLNAMFPHYQTVLLPPEPTIVYGSEEWNARVWFPDDHPDIIVKFRFTSPNIQITTVVNA